MQLLLVVVLGALVLGAVGGFAWALDRQVRGGILRQRAEAMARPDWVALESLPAYVPRAFLAVVDPEFEAAGALRSRDEGNTVARELVRTVHMLQGNLGGEARELVMAPVLERRASKRDLLELYLNRVYLGVANDFPVYGLFHASREYFGKDPPELTLSEAATLAGLLLEPRIERPEQRPGAVGIRRNEVLRALATQGLITQEQWAEAVNDRLGFQPGITEIPMSRRIGTDRDTMVIRLPPEYRPQPEDPEESS
jgi:hypothetical protein